MAGLISENTEFRAAGCPDRHPIVSATAQHASRSLFVDAAPLLKKERHTGRVTLTMYLGHPLFQHRSSTRPGLAADDHPIDAMQIETSERPDERLNGEKFHGCPRVA